VSKPEQQPPKRGRAGAARATAAGLLWSQGLAALIWAGLLLPSAISNSSAEQAHGLVAILDQGVVTVAIGASIGAAALLVGTGLRRMLRGARAAGFGVQILLLAAALQSHRPVIIAVVAAVGVVTVAVLLAPALAGGPAAAGSEQAPGD
jgi:hypothetical protein